MRISEQKQNKIKENILALLYENSPKALYTASIAQELARDEEFTKKLLQEMLKQGLVSCVKKSPKGVFYKRRQRWKLSKKAYEAYSNLA